MSSLPWTRARVPRETGTQRFAIHGSATIGVKLIPHLIAKYADDRGWEASSRTCHGEIRLTSRKNPGQTPLIVDCHPEGSDTGIPQLAEGRAEIAMLSRPANREEYNLIRSKNYVPTGALQEHVLALDGVSIIVSKRNPINGLTLDKVREIFRQSDGNRGWKLHLLDEQSGTRAIFETMLFSNEQKLPACGSSNVQCFSDPKELVMAVARDSQGVGFIGSAYGKEENVKIVPILGRCGIKQEPSIFNIKTEDYLFSRQLLLYTARVKSLQSTSFMFYVMSDSAQPAIEEAGYVSQSIVPESVEDSQDRLAIYEDSPPKEDGLDHSPRAMSELRKTLKKANRLSVSFRFRFNSTTLDTRAFQDLHRLADYLTYTASNNKIMLVGFTDKAGSAEANVVLSLSRANAIAGALEDLGIQRDRIVTKGAGELMPVACNDSELGQSKNRRVEVWKLP